MVVHEEGGALVTINKHPHEVDVDEIVDERGIQYFGKAVLQEDGKFRCLAAVGGCLCLVEVRITTAPQGVPE